MTNPCRLNFKPRALAAFAENLLALDQLGDIYDARPDGLNPQDFLQYTLDALGVDLKINNEQHLEQIPREGPLL